MRLTVTPHREQPEGAFDNGAILERKPIGFPQDGGAQRAVSTLFYWAHAWSPRGGLIDLHPHQGFEILTFVLRGSIQHYDSAGDGWRPIVEGGAQVIRAGRGVSHAERLAPGAAIFQIWLDPDLRRAIKQPPSYTDYPPERFGLTLDRGRMVKTYAGPDGAIEMDTPGIAIREYLARARRARARAGRGPGVRGVFARRRGDGGRRLARPRRLRRGARGRARARARRVTQPPLRRHVPGDTWLPDLRFAQLRTAGSGGGSGVLGFGGSRVRVRGFRVRGFAGSGFGGSQVRRRSRTREPGNPSTSEPPEPILQVPF